MWNKITETPPPYYKKLWIWVDKDEYRASYTREEEWIYWDLDEGYELEGCPTHWRETTAPIETPKSVCF